MGNIMTWVDVELAPCILQPDGRVLLYLGEYPEIRLMSTTIKVSVEEMINRIDEDTCAAEGCSTPVGFVLHDDDDDPHRGARWHWTTFVRAGNKVIAVCEGCSPANLYSEALVRA